MRCLPPAAVMVLALATCAGAAGASGPDRGLADAREARAMLGGSSWSEVLRISNSNPRSSYPRTVYALAFELEGILWFYTDADGTQSLSLRRGRVAEDEADPGPLLRAIDPGFTAWEPVPDGGVPAAAPRPGALPNGCFIESVAALRRRLITGGQADRPRLLSFYADTPAGRLGHTVLVYSTSDGAQAIDAERSERPVRLPPGLGDNALALARFIRGGEVAAARVLPVSRPPAGGCDGSIAGSTVRREGLPPAHSSAS
jgi:hypothetical protein